MSTVTATRSELLARRSQEAVARRGHTLLEQKRAALIAELRRLGLEVADKRAELERIAAAARRALGQAVAADGPRAVSSAALAASGTVPAEVCAAVTAEVEREDAAAAVEVDRIRRAAQDRHDLAVRRAAELVLAEETRCSSR